MASFHRFRIPLEIPTNMNGVLETERLRLRPLTLDDAAIIFELVNDPDWLRFVGGRGVRDLKGACDYLEKGALAHHRRQGFGTFTVEPKSGGEAVGVCGLIRRQELEDVDLSLYAVQLAPKA